MASFHHIFIAVMGTTGVGKSTLIQTLTGKDVSVGHGLHSCTEKIEDHFFVLDRYIVHLIDTPGFDDTKKSDVETLQEVATWLAVTYRSQVQLTGILYLHRISDNRMGGNALKNLTMFKKLCGERCLPNVILLTTMWDQSPMEFAVQEAREHELHTDDDFWAGMLRLGARSQRYYGTKDGAEAIIRSLLTRPKIVLDIQRQLVDEGKNLNETAAGRHVRKEMIEAEEKHRDEIRTLKQELEQAQQMRDEATARELRERTQQLERKLEQMDHDKRKLESDLQTQLLNHQLMVQQLQSDQKLKWTVIGVGLGALTVGLGALGAVALAGGAAATAGTAATTGGVVAGASAAQIACELGRRAVAGATFAAVQLGARYLAESNTQRAGQRMANSLPNSNPE